MPETRRVRHHTSDAALDQIKATGVMMRDKFVKLDRSTVLELACRLFQANRAVTGLSEFHWPRLLRYYDPGKIAELRDFIERMRSLLPPGAARTETAMPPDSCRQDYQPTWWRLVLFHVISPFLVYCRPLYNGRRSRWSFQCQELAYMLSRLEAFLRMLGSSTMPGYPAIISLRTDLMICHDLINGRCDGLQELKQVYSVEYYNMAPHLNPLPVSAIVKRAMPSAA